MTAEQSENSLLPPGIAIAWGLERPASRGMKAELSPARIIDAAIKIADADGLAAVSMTRVAASLGFTTMSLYRHVRSKEELLVLMRDRAFGRPDLQRPVSRSTDPLGGCHPADGPEGSNESGDSCTGDWRSSVGEWARAVEARYRAHPWVLEYRLTAPPATPNELLWLEMLLRVLAATPLSPSEKLSSALMLGNLVRSVTKLEIDVSSNDSPEALEEYGSLLFRLLDPEEYREVLGVFSDPTLTVMDAEGAELQFVLERFLDGVAVLIANRS